MSSAAFWSRAGMPMRRRAGAVAAGLVVALLSLQIGALPPAQAADVAPRLYQDQAFPTAGSSPTEDKPQSKLWFAEGSWWALMRTTTNGSDGTPDVTVHELQDDHTWRDTGALVDRRSGSTGDALWEGGKLYVASRSTSGAVQVGRLSFDPGTDTYAMDAGFPVAIGSGSVESVTIARDSLRRLWVTYTEPDPADATLDRVLIAHSTTDDTMWTAPFAVPVPDNTVKADDISAIVAFSGKVGVMWSDQQNEVVRFAVHPDAAADDSDWTMETALDGTRSADDHLNLKSLLEDDAGRIYAAVKTSLGDSSTDSPVDPGIRVLTRSSAGGWTAATAATVGEGLTRPQLALDATNRELYVVMSTEGGGDIYYKKSPLGASLSFPAGTPGETLLTWSGALINDATTAKAPITAESGLVVLASDDKTTKRYYHAELDLDAAPADSVAPSVPSGVTAVADSASQVTVRWAASTDAIGVASYRVLRDAAVVAEAVTSPSFVDTTVAAGAAYSYTVSAVDAAGNRSAESEPAAVRVPAAAPGVVARGSTQAGSTSATTTVSVPRPAGVATGDVLVAQINADDAPAMGAVPAGWAAVVEPLSMGTSARLFVYSRVVTDAAAEPASYVWQLATAEKWNAALTAFGGVDAGNPFDTPVSTAVTAQKASTLSVPGVSTSTAGALLVGGVAANNATLSVTEPTGFTELVEARGAQVTEQAAQARPTAGATGPATWRLNASYTAAGWLRALRPAGSGGDAGPPAPTASFTVSPTSGTAPLAVQFTDTSTGSPTSWAWDFGDGSTSTEQNPGHAYASAGNYSVTVTATNAVGSSTSAPRTITVATPQSAGEIVMRGSTQAGGTSTTTVSVPRPAGVATGDVLVAQINADDAPAMGAVPAGWAAVVEPLSMGTSARLFVYSRVVTDAAAEPASYVWQLATAEKWNAALTAFGGVDAGNPFDTPVSTAVTAQKASTLSVPGVSTSTAGALLVGGVAANNATLSVTEPTGFTELVEARGAQVTEQAAQARPTAGATGPATWRLNASYTAAGWLRALRPAGSGGDAGPPAPTASFTVSPTSGTAPLAVQFTDTSTGSPTSWAWDFGDGSTSTEQNPGHAYASAGNYSVTVTATNAVGSSTSAPRTITVATPQSAGEIVMRGSTQAGGTSTTTVSVPRPAGVATGDVLVAQINADDAPAMGAVPAGWAAVVEPLSMGTSARLFVYSRVVTDAAAEPASYVWQLATAEKWNAALTAFGGVDAGNPFDTPVSTAVTAQKASTLSVPGVSTSTAGALLVGGVAANNATLSVTEPTGFTELVEARGAQVTEQAAQARPTAGATGPATWRLNASYTAAGWLRALRPATS